MELSGVTESSRSENLMGAAQGGQIVVKPRVGYYASRGAPCAPVDGKVDPAMSDVIRPLPKGFRLLEKSTSVSYTLGDNPNPAAGANTEVGVSHSRKSALRLGSTVLLERERELAGLAVAIAEAKQGTGQLAVVQGPAGIGKTALLTAARMEAERAGMRALTARGSELEREFAYGVVRQLFESVLASATETERADLLAGAAAQATTLFGCAEPTAAQQLDGDTSFAKLHGLFWLTANLCTQGPLLVIVDDLHWCDTPSLRFFVHLLPRLDGLPLLVLLALRPFEPAADQHLLAQIVTDPLVTLVRPAPLSQPGSARLVRALLDEQAEDAFCMACHAATGGNPLLLRELASMAIFEGVTPTAAGIGRLAELASRAIGQRVALRLARLGSVAAALAGAVAILGEEAEPSQAAALAGIDPGKALEVARELAAIEILRVRSSHAAPGVSEGMLGFVHPLVRAAVYDGMSERERIDGHARAVQLLTEAGAPSEQVAAHLLPLPPAGNEQVTVLLRQAADEAFSRGSPEIALAYLERCLKEPVPAEQRVEVLTQLGSTAQLVDMTKAVEYLTVALSLVNNSERRAMITEMLGRALQRLGRHDEAVQMYSRAADALGEAHPDLRWRLEAGLLTVALTAPALRPLAEARINRLPPTDTTVGGKMLDCVRALHETFAGVPAQIAVTHARRGLSDDTLLKHPSGNDAFISACIVLVAADHDDAMPLLDALVAEAHLRGSVFAFGILKCYRALAWLWRGFLSEAEIDVREALQAITASRLDLARPLATAFLADSLMEQGRLEEAESALKWVDVPLSAPSTGAWYRILDSRARLLMLQGRTQESLETMLACGQCYEVHGRSNPALVAWRSGAAHALLLLDRRDEARPLAAEELSLVRQWGAPRALGHALRIAGLIEGGEKGLELLREAVAVLESSPARLEYAKSLVELGAALRRLGRREESRRHLRGGVEQAEICGATSLAKRGLTELRATGARPRRTLLSGASTLTPSERQVVELAATGRSNQEIAQALYVTTKTVEAHLTRAYRKLGITSRASLAEALTTSTSSDG
jgi:DNA-binding CsgD family transcriptional regulator